MSNAEDLLAAILRRLDQMEKGRGIPESASLATLAERSGLSVDTLRREIDRRRLRYFQIGERGAIRVRIADFEKWLDRHTVEPLRP